MTLEKRKIARTRRNKARFGWGGSGVGRSWKSDWTGVGTQEAIFRGVVWHDNVMVSMWVFQSVRSEFVS